MHPLSRRGFMQAACTSVAAITCGGNAFGPVVPEGMRRSSEAVNTSLKDAVVSGKFGTALNAAWSGAESAQVMLAYKTFPLTVEFWCKLDPSPLNYNFIWTHNTLVANEPRESADHWAIHLDTIVSTDMPPTTTYGTLSGYLPGMSPEVIQSSRVVADGQWHYVAMVIDGKSVALYVDGDEVVRAPIFRKSGGTVIPGKLTVGKANLVAGGTLDFNGAIDDLRLSNVAREICTVPAAPLRADAQTIGLWSFDDVEGAEGFADASSHANPLLVSVRESLDEIERASYKAGPSPLGSPAQVVSLHAGAAVIPALAPALSLDGQWQLVEGATANWDQWQLVEGATVNWDKPITAMVPGSVHTALYDAGIIPFPYDGRNQEIAATWSEKTYWYQKTFPRPPAGQDQTLVFHGICNRCTIWLNGRELGQHEGMFTRVEFPVHGLLGEINTLVVKLDPAVDWKKSSVAPIFYGDSYTRIPPLGIWRSVEIRGEPSVKICNPFISTRDAKAGLMDLIATLAGAQDGWAGRLVGVVSPENFLGQPYTLDYQVTSAVANRGVHLQFNIPQPQLWWPVDIGKPSLYRLTLAFLPAANGGVPDVQQTTFGIRTVHMAPVNRRPRPRLYN